MSPPRSSKTSQMHPTNKTCVFLTKVIYKRTSKTHHKRILKVLFNQTQTLSQNFSCSSINSLKFRKTIDKSNTVKPVICGPLLKRPPP